MDPNDRIPNLPDVIVVLANHAGRDVVNYFL